MTQTLLRWSDNLIELAGLTDAATGLPITDATVQVWLTDPGTGAAVPGETWPLTLAAVTGTPGTYRATLGYTLEVTTGQPLDAKVVANAGVGRRRRWNFRVCVAESTQT